MLYILMGRARSGKSRYIAERIRALGDESRQILLVPQYATHETEIDLCRACGATTSRHAEVLSFEGMAARVLACVGGAASVELDGGGKLLTMQKTMEEVAPELLFFRRSFMNSSFLKNLVSLADEFQSYCVTAEQIYALSEQMEGNSRNKLRDLAVIIGGYEAKLTGTGIDRRSPVCRMAEKLSDSGYVRDKDIFIDGISYFNECEKRVITVMLRESRSVTVSMLADKKDKSGIFKDTQNTVEELKRLARENGVPCEVIEKTGEEDKTALGFLERNFFETEGAYAGDLADSIRVVQAESPFAEVETVAAEIRKLVAREGYRYRDIGITVQNMEEYRPLLEPILRRGDIPFFMNEQKEVLLSPLCTLTVFALASVVGGYEYEDMFRWLKTGLGGLTDEECDLLENYCIRWKIRGSFWTREEPWHLHPDGYGKEWTEESRETLAMLNGLRMRVHEPLVHLADAVKNGRTVREMLTGLYTFLTELSVPEQIEERADTLQAAGDVQAAEEYSQLWNILMHVMDEFAEILGEQTPTPEEFARLFRLVLSEYRVGSIPVALDQVKVTPLQQNDRQTVRALFILGANEGVIPALPDNSGLLTETERLAIRDAGYSLSQMEEEKFTMGLQNLYAALAQAEARLTVTYPTSDATGGELQASFVISRLQVMFPTLTVEKASNERLTVAPKSALPLTAEEGGEELLSYFSRKGGYEEELAAMRRASAVERGRLSAGAVELLYGKKYRMSASRIDRVRQCHYAYFLQYGLHAKERTASVFDAVENGTFIHYILENVSREAVERGGFAAVEDETLRDLTRQYARRYAEEKLMDDRQQNARFRYIFRRVTASAEKIVLNLAGEFRCSDFVPLGWELRFGHDGKFPAIQVQEGENALQISGSVDRVDGWEHDGKLYLRVVDYKTGKKKFDFADVRYGLNLQMLLYLFTLEREGGEYFGKPIVPAGVLYLPAREEMTATDFAVSEEEAKQKEEKNLRRSGFLLNEPEVLEAMEHGASQEKECTYLPLTGKNVEKTILHAEKIGILARHVERQLHEITREIAAGTVAADPCGRSEDETSCTFCEFRTACHFQDGVGEDHIRYIRPVTKDWDEYWRELAGEESGGEGK